MIIFKYIHYELIFMGLTKKLLAPLTLAGAMMLPGSRASAQQFSVGPAIYKPSSEDFSDVYSTLFGATGRVTRRSKDYAADFGASMLFGSGDYGSGVSSKINAIFLESIGRYVGDDFSVGIGFTYVVFSENRDLEGEDGVSADASGIVLTGELKQDNLSGFLRWRLLPGTEASGLEFGFLVDI